MFLCCSAKKTENVPHPLYISTTFFASSKLHISGIAFSRTNIFDWKNPRTSNEIFLPHKFTVAILRSSIIVPEKISLGFLNFDFFPKEECARASAIELSLCDSVATVTFPPAAYTLPKICVR